MPILAESINGVLSWVFFIPIVAVGLALVSMPLARRGHWSAPLLAIPAILFGLYYCYSLVTGQTKGRLLPGVIPLFVGGASVILWVYHLSQSKERE